MSLSLSLHAAPRRVITLAVVAATVAGCSKKSASRTPTVPVRIAVAQTISAPISISANGVVEPLQTVSIEAQVGGTLDDVSFHEGDEVQAGEVLFRIDPRPFEAALRQASAALVRDAAQADAAQRDAERYQALVAKDYVTKSQADQSVATAAALRASVAADSAAEESARLNLAYTTIRAPIQGRTGSLLVRRGNLVKANGDPLVVINQIHPILVRFSVTQRDFLALEARAASGSVPVRVATADSLPFDEAGTLTFIDNAVDSLTGTVTAKARFENASRKLWPGEYVRVTTQLGVEQHAIAVPAAAIVSGQNGQYVYVIDNTDNARVRPVNTGRDIGTLTVIDSGLVAGERVVVDGQSRLVPGSKVDTKAASGQSSKSSP